VSLSSDSDIVEASAAAWLAKREGGHWSAADQVVLERWLEESTGNRIAFIRLQAAWERSERLSALGAGVATGNIPARDSWVLRASATPLNHIEASHPTEQPAFGYADTRSVPSRRISVWMTRAAAAVVVAAGISGGLWYWSSDSPAVYTTQIGGLSSIPLSDGSTVTLNTDSQIEVDLKSSERRITLKRGEAFFEVSKNATRPFIVTTGDKQVTAVGTQFAVFRQTGEMRVLVTEGRVQVANRSLLGTSGETPVDAGSEATTTNNGVVVDHLDESRLDQLLSWRSGYVTFRDTPLPDAVADFNRYSVRKIVIDDPSLSAIQIGGRFRSNDADAFLSLLQTGFPIKVSQSSGSVHLTRRESKQL
jgi:transmembrane sensor